MLINDEADSRRSVAIELIIWSMVILGVGAGVYQIQHPHINQQPQVAAATR